MMMDDDVDDILLFNGLCFKSSSRCFASVSFFCQLLLQVEAIHCLRIKDLLPLVAFCTKLGFIDLSFDLIFLSPSMGHASSSVVLFFYSVLGCLSCHCCRVLFLASTYVIP